jgi:hypothetical protein
MSVATKLALANLALDHIGEPSMSNFDTDTGTTADSVRRHYDPTVNGLLEEHNFAFSKKTAQGTRNAAYVTAALTVDPTGADNTMIFTAADPGAGGNDITIEIATAAATLAVAVSGTAITITPGSGTTAQDIIDEVNGDSSASALVTASASGTVTGTVSSTLAATNLTGGKMWQSAFTLPTDCLKLRKVNGDDVDAPRTRFDLEAGTTLMLWEKNAENPVLEYTSDDANDPATITWPSAFADAVALLLASKLAKFVHQHDGRSQALYKEHLIHLGKARSKDARETKSGENHGPRQLAARSGLVNARYGSTQPPF